MKAKTSRRAIIKVAVTLAVVFSVARDVAKSSGQQAQSQPHNNVVLILVDDLGCSDLSCTGSTFYETPNIDRLRSEGVLFTDSYAAASVCSPTRASILTGKYPARVGVTDVIVTTDKIHPRRGQLIDAAYVDHLPLKEVSLATALKNNGYQTWHLGKWHLGGAPYFPDKHGFDINIAGSERGMIRPHLGYFSPWGLEHLSDEGTPGEYLSDRLTEDAIELIRNRKQGKPFFLNLWYYCVHMPIQAKPDLTAKYTAKAQRLEIDEIDPLTTGEPYHTEHQKGLHIQRRLLQSDPTYAAMIESLDTNIGRLMDCLDEQGIAKDTLFVFTSDNGGVATKEEAPTSNRPFREGKGWMYEGGLRVPLIMRMTGTIEPRGTCNEPVISTDLYPTVLDAAGLAEMPDQHSDGVSLWPLTRGESSLSRDAIFWHYPHYGEFNGTPSSAIRKGDWKLIEFFEDDNLELYNLANDPSEAQNLVATQPELAASLHAQLKGWRDEVDAHYPRKNPDWKASPDK